jgi:hypothetical protein
MVLALKEQVIVGPAGRIVIDRTDLPEGSTAEVIVVAKAPAVDHPTRLSDVVGKAKGQFPSSADADAYLNALR